MSFLSPKIPKFVSGFVEKCKQARKAKPLAKNPEEREMELKEAIAAARDAEAFMGTDLFKDYVDFLDQTCEDILAKRMKLDDLEDKIKLMRNIIGYFPALVLKGERDLAELRELRKLKDAAVKGYKGRGR